MIQSGRAGEKKSWYQSCKADFLTKFTSTASADFGSAVDCVVSVLFSLRFLLVSDEVMIANQNKLKKRRIWKTRFKIDKASWKRKRTCLKTNFNSVVTYVETFKRMTKRKRSKLSSRRKQPARSSKKSRLSSACLKELARSCPHVAELEVVWLQLHKALFRSFSCFYYLNFLRKLEYI